VFIEVISSLLPMRERLLSCRAGSPFGKRNSPQTPILSFKMGQQSPYQGSKPCFGNAVSNNLLIS
jgi:hypothetical protein